MVKKWCARSNSGVKIAANYRFELGLYLFQYYFKLGSGIGLCNIAACKRLRRRQVNIYYVYTFAGWQYEFSV